MSTDTNKNDIKSIVDSAIERLNTPSPSPHGFFWIEKGEIRELAKQAITDLGYKYEEHDHYLKLI